MRSEVLHLRADHVQLGDAAVFASPLVDTLPLVGTVIRLVLVGDDVLLTLLDGQNISHEVTISRGNTVPVVRLRREQ